MMKKRTGWSAPQRRLLMLWVLCGILLLGAAMGTVCILFFSQSPMTKGLQWINTVLIEPNSASFARRLGHSFTCGAALLSFAFLFGFSMIGQLAAGALLLYFGGQVSMALLELLCCSQQGGRFFCIALLLLFVGCLAGCLVFAVRESLRFSGRLIRACFSGEEQENMQHQLQLYCIRFLVLLGFLLVSCLLYSAAWTVCLQIHLI